MNTNIEEIILPQEHEISYSPNNQQTQFYCYIYTDPNQPGNYNYNNIEVKHKPVYIGNSSAYNNNRWKHHLYESSPTPTQRIRKKK